MVGAVGAAAAAAAASAAAWLRALRAPVRAYASSPSLKFQAAQEEWGSSVSRVRAWSQVQEQGARAATQHAAQAQGSCLECVSGVVRVSI